MARVRHPNVVTIHGAQRIDGVSGLWMELVDGRTLAAELAERGPFPAEDLIRAGSELCQALAAVHRAGLVHRTSRRRTSCETRRGRLVLGDFGTGRELDEAEDVTSGLAGTPAYLAPEIFERQPATPQSDLYSLGALLFHLATGRYPVEGRSLRELRDAHARGQRATLAARRPDLPDALTTAIETALDPDPAVRFRSAEAMSEALLACASGSHGARPRARRLAGIAASVLILAGAAGLVWFTRAPTPTALPFAARDFVLVTAFENRTGEPLLDGTLELALERELSASPFVNVVPGGRVRDGLALMRKAADTRVDAGIGREIALRDGKIRALVSGRVEKIGGAYSLSTAILNPTHGAIVAGVQEAAAGPDELLFAITRIWSGRSCAPRGIVGHDRTGRGVVAESEYVLAACAAVVRAGTRCRGGGGWRRDAPSASRGGPAERGPARGSALCHGAHSACACAVLYSRRTPTNARARGPRRRGRRARHADRSRYRSS